MIGLDFPVKPAWIHDVLSLWQPDQPIGVLVGAALAQTMTELGGEKTRRNSLTVILRYFIPTTGGGKARRTTSSNVWASYAAAYSPQALAPAYLARIIAGNDVAQEAFRFIIGRGALGGVFTSSELRRHMIARFGQRKVVLNSASAFLQTLVAFGALTSSQRPGEYLGVLPLPVSKAVFPLLVWASWERQGGPQIDTDAFAVDPAFSLVETEQFAAYWQAYAGRLWSVEERLETRRVTLRHPDRDMFERAMISLLAETASPHA